MRTQNMIGLKNTFKGEGLKPRYIKKKEMSSVDNTNS